jgi:ABC-type Fe3+/spermidine/putrescine transport system ATPase subunit
LSAQENLPTKVRGSLQIERVFKKRGGVKVLEDVSLQVRPGEFVTLLGPSGCGKTTLLRLIAGLDEVDGGRIVVSGQDVTEMKAHLRPVHHGVSELRALPSPLGVRERGLRPAHPKA